MKKVLFVLFIVGMITTSCQPKTKVAPVDLAAAKVAVTELLDKFSSGMKSKDANALTSLFTDDCLICGTDSRELLSKVDWSNMMVQTFADTSLNMNYTIDKREIRVSKDGNSAIVLEQTLFKSFSQNMPVRIIFHLVKGIDNWLFDFFSISFIPNNEDIDKLNKALE